MNASSEKKPTNSTSKVGVAVVASVSYDWSVKYKETGRMLEQLPTLVYIAVIAAALVGFAIALGRKERNPEKR